ncbi:MAG: hypothetical protein M1829_000832 [Trizodia sp. TS-e1964]|nr:MAG: hypothetical protein M1829_000832 [Trizodia sp. TS-e1964]
MPRVTSSSHRNQSVATATPHKSSVRIPLNDDAQEKAVRLQSRNALHDLQMNQIKAAASPMRKLNNFERAASSSPRTPRGSLAHRERDRDNESLGVVAGNAITPLKRVPILANFEEWMKMATDNKINATNSWNFALIDYFHDMSLLKEGDGVNFQKASCTLDGCVKIYTSRVDSVATETGKLLSGLADSGNKKRKGGEGEEGEENEADGDADEEEGEDGVKKRPKKKAQRSSEATLASSFASLQLKKLELEFSVDPLFKKASADFDEGGAKGLLLNHLAIDSHGRIVFDSSDDAGDATAEGDSTRRKSDAVAEDVEKEDIDEPAVPDSGAMDMSEGGEADIDIEMLRSKFFPDLTRLDEQDICPSLKNFDLGDLAGSSDIPFLKAPEDWRQENNQPEDSHEKSGIFLDDDAAGFDDDDGLLGGFDIPADTGFGEGGEAWARDAAIEPQMRVHDAGYQNETGLDRADGPDVGVDAFNPEAGEYGVSIHQGQGKGEGGHDDILSYFDEALRKNWAGPEHWRIRKIKDNSKATAPTTKTRKEKEPFEIDFSSPLDPALAQLIYTEAATPSSILLPKSQWKSKTRNLLPDDKHFNSRQLLRLFLKPRARMGSKRAGGEGNKPGFPQLPQGDQGIPEGEMDEAFWAQNAGPANEVKDEAVEGNYDANFFQDDGPQFAGGIEDDDEDFADARDHFSPELEGMGLNAGGGALNEILASGGNPEAGFGAQLVTQSRRIRPEYVQYARVAKKVDVRRLKEEMWRGMGIAGVEEIPSKSSPPPTTEGPLKFTTVMNNLQGVYNKQTMADISTSYCFICLLHLANEKGLAIENQEGLVDLNIQKDFTAVITEGGG